MNHAEHIIVDAIIAIVALMLLAAVWIDGYLERRERANAIEVEPEDDDDTDDDIHDLMQHETRFGRWGVRERRRK